MRASLRNLRFGTLLIGVALVLAACGSEAESPAESADTAPAEQETAPAQDQEETETDAAVAHSFQDGDEVTIVLGSSPGGGFDTQARAAQGPIEQAFADVLGVDVTVVVENMPGAAHQVATEFVNRADPDGRTVLFSAAPLITENQVLKGADYDLREMSALASAGTSGRAIAVRTDLGLEDRTLEALVNFSQNEPVLLGHPGIEGGIALLQVLLGEGGWTFNVDPASVGQTAEIMTAMLRGDVQAGLTTGAAMKTFVDDNPDELQMLVNLNCEREEGLEDLPTIVDEGVPNAEQICLAVGGTPRVFLGPPGMSEGDIQAWSDVLEAALTSDEYVSVVEESGLALPPADHEQVASTLTTFVETFQEHKETLEQAASD